MMESTGVFLPSPEGVNDPLTEGLRAGAGQLMRHAPGLGAIAGSDDRFPGRGRQRR